MHRLVGAIAGAQLADQQMRFYPIDGRALRLNSLFVAVLMEELAKWSGESPRSCYTIGLLRTMGMLAMEGMTPIEAAVPQFLGCGMTKLGDWDQRWWGISHLEVAEKILRHWKLPEESVRAIRYHYDPRGKHTPSIHLLKLAAGAAADAYSCIPGEEPYWDVGLDNFAKAGINHRDFQMACERAHRKFEQLKIAIA